MVIDLELRRTHHDAEATQGYLIEKNNKLFWGYTCEDQPQAKKIAKETRIPSGRYKLILNKGLVNGKPTEKTQEYRTKYPWFTWHIMLFDVPGFQGIYIHVGNHDDHSEGCILLGWTANTLIDTSEKNKLQKSTDGFKNFYTHYTPMLEKGQEIYITIKDEDF